jgi:hypothetical protein
MYKKVVIIPKKTSQIWLYSKYELENLESSFLYFGYKTENHL